jgi:twitching motility protein PilT
MLRDWIARAREAGASDLHLEPGMPLAQRVRGELAFTGEPIGGEVLRTVAREVIGDARWPDFLERRSFDASRVIGGVQCRFNVMATARGVGLAVRLLAAFQPTIDGLNLHPDLRRLVRPQHGLVIVCGPTGSGKSTTLAALIHEVNVGPPRHVVTVENPIEYHIRPRRALIRQREVGRDTPSFEQALLDALREDPDVLMVGEMRRHETMQRTLDAAETGHLVLATMHSSTVSEALQRVVSAFPPESQAGVRAQLADSLIAVLAQRLIYRHDPGLRVPEIELLVANDAIRNSIREGRFFKIPTAMETGAGDGMWTFSRYRRWLDDKTSWRFPEESPPLPAGGGETPATDLSTLPAASAVRRRATAATGVSRPSQPSTPVVPATPATPAGGGPGDTEYVIDDANTGTIDELMAALKDDE